MTVQGRRRYGIASEPAPEWGVTQWFNLPNGQSEDTALQFWMGENPIFEKPQFYGIWPPINLDKSNNNVSGDSDIREEETE